MAAQRTQAARPDSQHGDWQRLDLWLWCARMLKSRADCARLVAQGLIRINRQPTDKPHARLRPGDVLTVPLEDSRGVRVLRVRALGARRGPAAEARLLYDDIAEDADAGHAEGGDACTGTRSPAYVPPQ